MKRRTKKTKAKIELLDLAKQHALLAERHRVAELIGVIDDLDLSRLVAHFILAKQELEFYLEQVKTEVAPYLPDDSDF
jgi:cell fate (sporulation/competence/biofilm development) regulator YlbF (YheA/YmcA/DUF963 family)